ncbi:DUF2530 domain-containing protein [Leifsonia sp. Leaf264]|uniref:DUF2530 domain-containing protein n=1 Tax=Leifsonia sp. Leaf264 TaxID=1736314 RepID=UPI0006F3E76A|nr:DUF2530 domain-containing protein [Leifsonia sp. Leaf264]KQP01926.1 hypothetical protein ASF30_05065 [Leifsonia sp. Leaf264]
MRIWLKDSERRPDPEPARADGRKAVVAGTAAWVIALVVWFIWDGALTDAGYGWWLWMCITGIALGVIGLVVVQVMRRG